MKQRSKRLDALAKWVPKSAVFIDVGCDHGWLPLSLLAQDRIAKAIAIDKKPAPLAIANQNASRTGWTMPFFQTLQNDGLIGLDVPRGATVNIAGMGGKSIIQILSQASLTDVQLLLQPNDHMHLVRAFLWENGWGIVRSDCIEERGQFYFVMESRQGKGQQSGSEEDKWLCPILRRTPTPAWKRWIQFRHRVLQKADLRSAGNLSGDALIEYQILRGISWLAEPRSR
ncbi:MAG: class I SAM-dependent methyltransferase [Myxococcota bacterium]|nr:class I SAM-dependent methyltransferase [Myxococcota bacterium]